MDVVYVLGTGSLLQDLELRYSLRSLEQFVTGIGTVYLVGRCPSWATGVVHLAYPDRHRCKERNIMEKVSVACHFPDVSAEFLHVHDDHFALSPTCASETPNWYAGDLGRLAQLVRPGNSYLSAVLNTQQVLQEAGRPTLNFDVHTPIVYHKQRFLEAMNAYDWARPRGFVVKSLYANHHRLAGTYLADVKLSRRHPLGHVVKLLKGRPWWSLGNGALDEPLRDLLQALYPHKSRFEL